MSAGLSAYLPVFICLFAFLTVCRFVRLLACLSATVCLSVCLSVCLPVCLCLCHSLWRRANARNVTFITRYGGQFTFSTLSKHVCLSACLHICPPVCLLFCLPICAGWARKAYTCTENYFQLTWTRKKIPDSEILISDGDQVLRRASVAKLDFPKQQRNSETWIQCELEKHQLTWSKIKYFNLLMKVQDKLILPSS